MPTGQTDGTQAEGRLGPTVCQPPGRGAGIEGCRIIQLPKVPDPRGNLTFIEGAGHIPFAIKRVFYLYDVPGGAERGAHGHRRLEQFIVAVSGSFDVVATDGVNERRFHLNRPYSGLYVCPMIWSHLENLSSGAVCLVLASDHYDESDYLRDYRQYLAEAGLPPS